MEGENDIESGSTKLAGGGGGGKSPKLGTKAVDGDSIDLAVLEQLEAVPASVLAVQQRLDAVQQQVAAAERRTSSEVGAMGATLVGVETDLAAVLALVQSQADTLQQQSAMIHELVRSKSGGSGGGRGGGGSRGGKLYEDKQPRASARAQPREPDRAGGRR